jgi:hypothetical protein
MTQIGRENRLHKLIWRSLNRRRQSAGLPLPP